MRAPATLVCALAVVTMTAAQADGDLDPTFNFGGMQDVMFAAGSSASAYGSLLQPDGKLLIVGGSSNSDGDFDFAVARLLPNGALDAQFAPTDFTGGGRAMVHFELYPTLRTHNAAAPGVALQPGGRIVLAGVAEGSPYAEGGGPTSLALVRLLPNGTPDDSFGGSGTSQRVVDGAAALAVATLPDGTLAVAGADGSAPHLFVFDATGADILTSAGDLVAPTATGRATAIAVDAFGRIVVAGYYFDAAGAPTDGGDCFVTRYGYAGVAGHYVLDSAFGNDGRFVFGFDAGGDDSDTCYGIALQPDGKIIVVGEATNSATSSAIGIARLLADGSGFDPSFVNSGKFTSYFEEFALYNQPRAVKLLSDGKIVIAGSGGVADAARAPDDLGILRLNRDGSYDDSFVGSTPGSNEATVMVGFENWYSPGTGEWDGAYALSIDSADRICAVGAAELIGYGVYRMAVVRLESGKIFVSNFDRPPQ